MGDFQDITAPPSVKTYPLMDFEFLDSDIQFASLYPSKTLGSWTNYYKLNTDWVIIGYVNRKILLAQWLNKIMLLCEEIWRFWTHFAS